MEINREFSTDKTPYSYICSKCDFIEELYYRMDEDKPKEYSCPECNRHNSMHRFFGDKKLKVPFKWTDDMPFEFNKSPSKRKHFF